MKKFKVLLSKTAQKQLLRLDEKLIFRIKTSLKKLGDNPYRKRSGVDIKKLGGSRDPDLYRLRVGDYRIVYAITSSEVKVTEILHRKSAYKFLE